MDSNESGAGKTVMSYLGNCTYVGLVAMEIKKTNTSRICVVDWYQFQ